MNHDLMTHTKFNNYTFPWSVIMFNIMILIHGVTVT